MLTFGWKWSKGWGMIWITMQDLPDMVAIKDADFSDVDAVFCCLPHGTTQVFLLHIIYAFNTTLTRNTERWFWCHVLILLFVSLCLILFLFPLFLQEVIKGLPKGPKIVDLSAVLFPFDSFKVYTLWVFAFGSWLQ